MDVEHCMCMEPKDWPDEQDGERCKYKEPVDLLDESDVTGTVMWLELVDIMVTVDEPVADIRICKLGEFYTSCTETRGGTGKRNMG